MSTPKYREAFGLAIARLDPEKSVTFGELCALASVTANTNARLAVKGLVEAGVVAESNGERPFRYQRVSVKKKRGRPTKKEEGVG